MNPRHVGLRVFEYLVRDPYPSVSTVVVPMLARVPIYVSRHVFVALARSTIGEETKCYEVSVYRRPPRNIVTLNI